jgi:putative isomerase
MTHSLIEPTPWHRGRLVAFSGLDGQTAYDGGLVARTLREPAALEIRDPGLCRLVFSDTPVEAAEFGGDFFSLPGTRGAVLDAYHVLIEGPCEVAACEPAIRVLTQGNRTLAGSAAFFNPALIESDLDKAISLRRAWLAEQLGKPPADLAPASRRTLTRALTMMKTQVYAPENRIQSRWTTPDRWPHKDMWLWDSAFHAIGFRHLDPALAREAISAMLDVQGADGFIPHRANAAGAQSDFTQPPVLALAAKLVLETEPAPEWLAALHPRLAAYVEWDLANRDTDGAGLLEWFIEEDPNCRSGESGMDNSPRFDAATQLDAVDFNAFAALECEILAEFAETLGRPEDAAKWKTRQARLNTLINERLWDPERRFYCDYDPAAGARTEILSSAGFLPLICGAASPEQAAALLEHLSDPASFGTAVPVPSIAVSDAAHYSKDMWRGPMWVNINWFIAYGLRRNGLEAAAASLEAATRAEIERQCENLGTFFEYFDDRAEVAPPDLLRKAECSPEKPYRQVIHDFGWTATLYVDLVLGRNSGNG